MLMDHTKCVWPLAPDALRLHHLIDAGLFGARDAVEDVVDAADQQVLLRCDSSHRDWFRACDSHVIITRLLLRM